MRRLQVLLESNLDIPAYNLMRYLVQNVFEDYQNKRPKFSYLQHEWLDKDMDKAHNILDIHIAILYRRKEDTSQLQYLVTSSRSLLHAVAEYFWHFIHNFYLLTTMYCRLSVFKIDFFFLSFFLFLVTD